MDVFTKIGLAATCLAGTTACLAQIAGPPRSSTGIVAFRSEPQAKVTLQKSVPEAIPASEPLSPNALTLDECEGTALANHPAIAQANALVLAARGNWLQVGLPPNPVGGYLGSEIGNEGRAGQQGGFVGQEFVRGGKLRLNRAVAAQEVRIAENRLAASRFRVLTDTRQAFFDLLIAQQRVAIAQQLMGLSKEGLSAAEGLFKGRQVAQVDVLQAQIEFDAAQIVANNARNDLEAARRQLGAIIGMPIPPQAEVTGSVREIPEMVPIEHTWNQILAGSPELGAAGADLSRARQAIVRARAERIPNVEVQGGLQHDNATTYDIAFVQIGVPLPILNRNQGGVIRAESELIAAQRSLDRLRNELWYRLSATYQRYANSHQQVTLYRDRILPNARRSLDLVAGGYRQGEFSYIALLTAQRTLFQTNLASLEALRQFRRSEAELQGLLLSGSLGAERSAIGDSVSDETSRIRLPLATEK